MKLFCHKVTGLEGMYPDHFGDMDFLQLEPVAPGDESPCVTCSIELPVEQETIQQESEDENDD